MTTPVHSTVKLNSPHDAVAAVPHLLGFWPTDSLVVIGFQEADGLPRFGMTLRTDLPAPEHQHSLADYLISGPVRNQDVDAVMLIVVGTRGGALAEGPPNGSPDDFDALPHRELVDVLHEAFGTAGVEVMHTAWTQEIKAGGAWWCYEDDRCHGEIADPRSTPLAAAMAASGAITFDSREDVEALVAPEAPEIIARRAAKLDALHDEWEERGHGPERVQEDLQTVFGAIRRTGEGGALTEDDQARVLLALSDNRVRDLVLGTTTGELASAAEKLWLTLVCKAPAPELADVAALLAFSAYLRGEGALAGAALARIEATRPEHRLGALLRRALDAGLPASELAVIAQDAAEDARLVIDGGGDW